MALRDWLEQRRHDVAERTGGQLPRPVAPREPAGARGFRGHPDQVRAAGRRPAETSAWTDEQRARALLADLLDWHRREDKPAWWRYFYLRTLSPAELIGEPDALGGLTGGQIVDEVKKSVVRRFSFPPQEHRFSAGDTAVDPETERGWPVWAVDDAAGTIELKVGLAYNGPLPAATRSSWPSRARPRTAGRWGLGAGSHPGRAGDDARGRRAAAGPDLPDAP